MAAIHRSVSNLAQWAQSFWDRCSRQTRWFAASYYRLLLAGLIAVFILILVLFGRAVAAYTQAPKLTDDQFRQMLVEALAAHPLPPTSAPVSLLAETATPFAPVLDTPISIPTYLPPGLEAAAPTEEATEPPAEVAAAPSMDFYGINFGNNKDRITIKISPKNKTVNGGNPIVISFLPGRKCNFGDQRACVNAFLNQNLGNTIFVSVHSGEGGEAQPYRNALEGTLVNTGAYTVKKVQSNMKALDGAKVVITQGKKTVDGLELTFISRVPPRSLSKYLSTSVLQALKLAVSIKGTLKYQTDPVEPQLVFETCGWRLPGEALSSVATATSASIYVAVIRSKNDP